MGYYLPPPLRGPPNHWKVPDCNWSSLCSTRPPLLEFLTSKIVDSSLFAACVICIYFHFFLWISIAFCYEERRRFIQRFILWNSKRWRHEGILHICKSKMDASGMSIDLYRPRSRSIDWSVMLYNSSRGVHPCPKQNIKSLSQTKDYRIFGVKQKSYHPKDPMSSSRNLKESASSYHRKAINVLNDNTKGSCTFENRGWTPRECQSARTDQDPDGSIGP